MNSYKTVLSIILVLSFLFWWWAMKEARLLCKAINNIPPRSMVLEFPIERNDYFMDQNITNKEILNGRN